ncbi:MAG: hypothetical protein WA137_05650 [Methanothrix sp.]
MMLIAVFSVSICRSANPADVARHDRLVSLVEQMLTLHKQLPEAGTPHEKTALERRIEATDGQIYGGPALWADGGGDQDCGRCCIAK